MNLRPPPSLCLIAVLVALFASCRPKEEAAAPAPEPPRVVVAAAEQRTLRPGFHFPARVEAISEAALRPEVTASVISRSVTPGSAVKKDEVLFELERGRYESALKSAEASLEQARAASERAESDFQRVERAQRTGAVAATQLDQAQAASRNAKAAVLAAEAAVERATIDLQDTTIVAPFDGRVSVANVAVGDLVSPSGAQPLVTIVQTDPVYVVAEVDQKESEVFYSVRTELEERGIKIPDLELVVILPTGVEYPIKGSFENWDPAGASSRGTIQAWTRFDNPDGVLVPGYNVTVLGRVQKPVERVMIPQKAMLSDQAGNYVFVVGDDGIATRRNIEIGVKEGKEQAVRSGLEDGERVIVEGILKVRSGAQVHVIDVPDTAADKPKVATPEEKQNGLLEAVERVTEQADEAADSGEQE